MCEIVDNVVMCTVVRLYVCSCCRCLPHGHFAFETRLNSARAERHARGGGSGEEAAALEQSRGKGAETG